MSDTEYAEAQNTYTKSLESWAPQGRRLGDETPRSPRSPGSAEQTPSHRQETEQQQSVPRGKRVEYARVSTQLVLNKYNTNYEALMLAN